MHLKSCIQIGTWVTDGQSGVGRRESFDAPSWYAINSGKRKKHSQTRRASRIFAKGSNPLRPIPPQNCIQRRSVMRQPGATLQWERSGCMTFSAFYYGHGLDSSGVQWIMFFRRHLVHEVLASLQVPLYFYMIDFYTNFTCIWSVFVDGYTNLKRFSIHVCVIVYFRTIFFFWKNEDVTIFSVSRNHVGIPVRLVRDGTQELVPSSSSVGPSLYCYVDLGCCFLSFGPGFFRGGWNLGRSYEIRNMCPNFQRASSRQGRVNQISKRCEDLCMFLTWSFFEPHSKTLNKK